MASSMVFYRRLAIAQCQVENTMKTPNTESITLLGDIAQQRVPQVQKRLLGGENPNQSITTDRSDQPKLLLQAVLDEFSTSSDVAKKNKYKSIAKLLWIFKGVTDIKDKYVTGSAYLETHRAKLKAQYKNVFDFDDPLLCLCYAVQSSLLNSKLPGHSQGISLLENILCSLTNNQLSGLQYFTDELDRMESGYFGNKYKISLESENFQCALLRNVLQDKNLLKVLNIEEIPEDQFNQDVNVRNRFRDSLIQHINNFYVGTSNINQVECNFTL